MKVFAGDSYNGVNYLLNDEVELNVNLLALLFNKYVISGTEYLVYKNIFYFKINDPRWE